MNTVSKQKVVLVVDDDPVSRSALHDSLVAEGFTVLVAPDGEQGLTLALEEHPDLVLLDLLMPKMDGIEMAKRLRADAWGWRAKVLILSNADDLTHVSTALEEGVFDYLVKADTPLAQIVAKIREMTAEPSAEDSSSTLA